METFYTECLPVCVVIIVFGVAGWYLDLRRDKKGSCKDYSIKIPLDLDHEQWDLFNRKSNARPAPSLRFLQLKKSKYLQSCSTTKSSESLNLGPSND